jgi:hypothetical protein
VAENGGVAMFDGKGELTVTGDGSGGDLQLQGRKIVREGCQFWKKGPGVVLIDEGKWR